MSNTVTHAKYAKMEFSGSDQCCVLPDKRRSEWLEWLSEGDGRTRINTVQLHPTIAKATRV